MHPLLSSKGFEHLDGLLDLLHTFVSTNTRHLGLPTKGTRLFTDFLLVEWERGETVRERERERERDGERMGEMVRRDEKAPAQTKRENMHTTTKRNTP